jgi:hypothetical protein
MALSDLAVFSEYAYSAMVEVLAQQVGLFNSATNGTIVLRAANHAGDFSDVAMWARISGLVRRRNAYGTGNVAEKTLEQLIDTMVKIAAGTPPVRIDPGQFRWIQANPELGGALIGRQLAEDTLADMLNTGLMAYVAASSGVAAVYLDAHLSGNLNMGTFNDGQAKFGDRAQSILCWIMHSKPIFDLYGTALANSAHLFTFGNVAVKTDPFGRPLIISDSPSLIEAGSPNHYLTAGLTAGAIRVDQNGDFDDNVDTLNGKENITRTYQAEWSYNLGLKGYAWDKAGGGKSPTDAAIGTAANWDQWATSHKDLAGILIETL